MATGLNRDDDMIERMELDLRDKIKEAYFSGGVEAKVIGVYSIDELEAMSETDLCNKLAVGVGYAGAESVKDPKSLTTSAPGGKTYYAADFVFHVILAVPHGPDCEERFSATKLLTILRRSIQGTACSEDKTNRTWTFVKEFPNVQDSTDTMLYYSQVWLLRLLAEAGV